MRNRIRKCRPLKGLLVVQNERERRESTTRSDSEGIIMACAAFFL
jgi:hypothetical protein